MSAPAHLPVLPIAPDGCTPSLPVLSCWLGQLDRELDTLRLESIPPGNGILPEILSRYGIDRLLCAREDLPRAWRWQAVSGRSVLVSWDDQQETAAPLPRHIGELPADVTRRRSNQAQFDQLLQRVRLQDAGAVLQGTVNKEDLWPTLMDLLAGHASVDLPPVIAEDRIDTSAAAWTVWNPLPVNRQATLSLTVGEQLPPWSLGDDSGAQTAVQVADGALDRVLLCRLDCPALACRSVRPLPEPLDSDHWQVDIGCLDNGILRAEFDSQGRIDRCAVDGRFLPVAGPLATAMVRGEAMAGTTTCLVLEDGPVRARLSFETSGDDGILVVTYSLLAGEDLLQLSVSWQPATDVDRDAQLCFPTPLLAAPALWRAGDGPPCSSDQRYRLGHDGGWLLGCRDLVLAQGAEGIRFVDPSHRRLRCRGGVVELPLESQTSLAIGHAQAPSDALPSPLVQPSRCCGLQLLADAPPPGQGSTFHLQDAGQLLPVWIRRDSDGWVELSLVESTGVAGRAVLHLTGASSAPQILDGGRCQDLRAGREPASWSLPYTPGSVLIVRWDDRL